MKETQYCLGVKFLHTKREWRSRYLSQEEVNDLAAIAGKMPETNICPPFEKSIGLPKPDKITIYAENNGEIISTPFKG